MALAAKGIDVRQTGNELVFRVSLKDSAGTAVISGTTSLFLYELQNDGSLKSYDFNDHTFKTTALTTPSVSMTHRQGNNASTNTGIWTYALSTVTGFTVGGIYISITSNILCSPPQREREFQYGGDQGDLLVTAGSTGQAYLKSDVVQIAGSFVAANNLYNTYVSLETGTAQAGGASTVTLRAGASATNDIFKKQAVFIMSGTGAGQTYNGTTKVATVDTAWVTQPDNTSIYIILGRIE